MSRWHLGSPDRVVQALATQSTLAAMLQRSHLQESRSATDSRRLLAAHAAGNQHWPKWLLEHYLFFRMPL